MSAPNAPTSGSTPDAPWSQWPHWMEQARLDDNLAADAYEATPPTWRAAIKTGLALTHMHFGSSTGHGREIRSNDRLGFWREHENQAAAWTVIAFSPSYAAAARMAAACIAPVLADVPLVGAVCVGGPPHPSALVSLELSGVEDVFVLDAQDLHALLEQCGPGHGRLLLLHAGELEDTAAFAHSLGLPCWQEDRAPTLVLPPAHAESSSGECAESSGFDMEALAFAQAGANFMPYTAPARTAFSEKAAQDVVAQGTCMPSPNAQSDFLPEVPAAPPHLSHPAGTNAARPHAQYVFTGPARPSASCPERNTHACAPLLTLTPGCEGFWLHPGLTPDFFRVHSLAFGLL